MELWKTIHIVCLFVVCVSAYNSYRKCDMHYMAENVTGTLRSYNYPFNYKNQLDTCRHIFYFADKRPGRKICFNFKRFQLESTTDDYLEFENGDNPGVPYCQQGELYKLGNIGENNPQNVFLPNFCWPAEYTQYLITFYVSDLYNNTGFYADYSVRYDQIQTQQSQSNLTEVDVVNINETRNGSEPFTALTTDAPCPENYYTCFNRKCILRNLMCDMHKDCEDGSDEDYTHARCLGKQDINTCDFESNMSEDWFCHFWSLNWIRNITSPFGPRFDHTIGDLYTGYFLFSNHQNYNYNLLSYNDVPIRRSDSQCFSFWYFMSGNVGSLYVNITSSRSSTSPIVWWRHGNYGTDWIQGEVDIPADIFPITQLSIQSDGKTEYGYSTANIGLDDISLLPGNCTGSDHSCHFELGFCGWRNDSSGGARWLRHTGPTETNETGPSGNTTGYGYYIYMEATGPSTGDKARLVSRPVSYGGTDSKCLQFSYHMYGRSVDKLEVLVSDYAGHEVSLWGRVGNHGNMWHTGRITLNSEVVGGPYKIIFQAYVGETERSDIALDNITLEDRFCSQPVDTTTNSNFPPPVATCSPYNDFRCYSGHCINSAWVCDNRADCPDGSDEIDCQSQPASLSAGAIIGMVVGAVMVIAAIITGVIIYKRSDSKSTRDHENSVPNLDSTDVYPRIDDYSLHGEEGDEPPPPYTFQVDNPLYSLDPPLAESSGVNALNVSDALNRSLLPPPYSSVERLSSLSDHANLGAVRTPSTDTLHISISLEQQNNGPPPAYSVSIYHRPALLRETSESSTGREYYHGNQATHAPRPPRYTSRRRRDQHRAASRPTERNLTDFVEIPSVIRPRSGSSRRNATRRQMETGNTEPRDEYREGTEQSERPNRARQGAQNSGSLDIGERKRSHRRFGDSKQTTGAVELARAFQRLQRTAAQNSGSTNVERISDNSHESII